MTFLRALYNLLKNCPARRAIYTATTQSNLFPLKFCAVRWLENENVAQRALAMLPHLTVFVREMEKTKQITANSFAVVAKFIKDPFLPAKLEFFRSLASDLEPFLSEFQTDSPLAPFLYDSLSTIVNTQMDRVVKPSVLLENQPRKNLELKNENLVSAKHVKLGIAVKSALRSMEKQPDLSILIFRKECKNVIVKFINKMLERSPLKYGLTKAISCLAPATAANLEISRKRMELLLTALLEAKWMNSVNVDKALQEFEFLCKDVNIKKELESYSRKTERLDHFWMRIVTRPAYVADNLHFVIKLVCTLSHGNANVERGFSVNSECLVENMHEELLIAQRTVYDHVRTVGGVEKVDLCKPLLHAARNAHSLYKEAMTRKKLDVDASSLERFRKRVVEKEVHELEAKKAKLLKDALEKAELLSEEINKLKKK